MIIEISVAVIAVAIVVLVIYLIKVLRTLDVTIKSVQDTVERVERNVDDISKQSVSVLEETKVLTADLNQKSQKLDSLFASAKGIGDSVDQVSASMVEQAEQHRVQLGNLLALTSFGLETWQQWKNIRKQERIKEED